MVMKLIAHDLRTSDSTCEKLAAAIHALGETRRCMESVWMLDTSLPSSHISRALCPYMKPGSSMIVAALHDHASIGLSVDYTDWLWEAVVRKSNRRERHITLSTI